MGKDSTKEFIMTTIQITSGLINDTSSLCFKKDVFMNESFSVDQFVSEQRKNASLETLREDLSTYLRVLKSAMIELINQDYADFVNLSSNLAGLDKSINNLCVPLGQLKEEVLAVRATFNDALTVARQHMNKKIEIKARKVVLQRLMSVVEGVNHLEKLCEKSIFLPDDQLNLKSANFIMDQEPGDVVEQIATELCQIDSQLKKTSSSGLLKNDLQRLENIRQVFQSHLEQSFLCALENTSGNRSLHSVLRAGCCINYVPALQDLFLRKIVRPCMMEIISERVLHQKGIEHIYKEVLDFIDHKCNPLLDTRYSTDSYCEMHLGYSFLVQVVWPEVVSCLESQVPAVFSPGNPIVFQKNYIASQMFLQRLYMICPTEVLLQHLKETPAHNTFLSKWNLRVYYQIRFQEIAGALEMAFTTPFLGPPVESLFCLNCTHVLYQGMLKCWSRDVHLDSLSHRFWKLNLQLVTRFIFWVQQTIIRAQDRTQSDSKPNNQEVLNNGLPDGALTLTTEPEPTTKHLVMLVSDLQRFHSKVPLFFEEVIQPVIITQGFRDVELLKASLNECASELATLPETIGELLVARLVSQCTVHLKMANEIPRLYRKTNREVPSKASTYVGLIFQPLETFETNQGAYMPETLWSRWRLKVAEQVAEHYLMVTRDVLHSVKKMEDSLKRLKKVREKTPTPAGSLATSGVITDDDKIRVQFSIDVQNFGLKVDSLNMQSSALDSYSQLVELVESARNTPSS